jgi:hypothetical protein
MSYLKGMMKRLGIFLAMIFGMGLLGGCGKLNDQEPAANKDATVVTNESRSVETKARQSIVTPDGSVYEGEMKDGRPNGPGTLTDARGSYQKGEWRNGAAYRVSGTCVLPDGTKEEGTWNNDGTTCGGTIFYPDKRIYKGDWVIVEGRAELPYGMGAMTWPDGRQYTGHFRNGKMDGAGKMTYADGKVEDGTWVQDAFQGAAK